MRSRGLNIQGKLQSGTGVNCRIARLCLFLSAKCVFWGAGICSLQQEEAGSGWFQCCKYRLFVAVFKHWSSFPVFSFLLLPFLPVMSSGAFGFGFDLCERGLGSSSFLKLEWSQISLPLSKRVRSIQQQQQPQQTFWSVAALSIFVLPAADYAVNRSGVLLLIILWENRRKRKARWVRWSICSSGVRELMAGRIGIPTQVRIPRF